jgi:hypothetical protein
MARRRASRQPHQSQWSRLRMLALLGAAVLTVVVLVAGLVLALVRSPDSTAEPSRSAAATAASSTAPSDSLPADTAARDSLAARAMPVVQDSASRPAPVSDRDPGEPILLPPATAVGPAGVPTGFPKTPEGALAQLAAIDQSALQSGSLQHARAVIRAWAMPGGPTTSTWSGVQAMRLLVDAVGSSAGGSAQLAVVLTPLMGLIKGTVGSDFVVPCVDFELVVTLQQTARVAAADCQRMVWHRDRWLIGPGDEPAMPPSVWPGTDLAIEVGYRDLRHD